MAESEQTDETQAASVQEAPANQPAAEGAAAEQAAATDAPAEVAAAEQKSAEVVREADEGAAAQAPPQGELAQRARSRGAAKAGRAAPPGTPEERRAKRAEQRRGKAVARRARRRRERERAVARRQPSAGVPELASVHAPKRGARKERQGIVVSDKTDKMITVRIDVARQHRRYEKIVRSSTTLHAHDEGNEAREGDLVRLVESRPMSRTKRWRLIDVLERAQ